MSLMKRLNAGLIALAAVVGIVGLSNAAAAMESHTFDFNPGCVIPGVDPGDCFGGIYGITIDQTGSGTDFDSYEVWMTVDTTGGLTFLSAGETGQLVNLEFKVASGDAVYANLAVIMPGSDGTWMFAAGPLGGKGCLGKNDDFVCMLETSMAGLNAIGQYTVGVSFDVAKGTEVMFHHLGVRFEDAQLNGNIVSIPSVPIPEPSAPLAFAAGSLIVGIALRRRATA